MHRRVPGENGRLDESRGGGGVSCRPARHRGPVGAAAVPALPTAPRTQDPLSDLSSAGRAVLLGHAAWPLWPLLGTGTGTSCSSRGPDGPAEGNQSMDLSVRLPNSRCGDVADAGHPARTSEMLVQNVRLAGSHCWSARALWLLGARGPAALREVRRLSYARARDTPTLDRARRIGGALGSMVVEPRRFDSL